MFRFTAATECLNRLALREKLQHFANGFGVPAHVDEEAAARMVLTEFVRQVRVELELLTLECVKTEP
jgi:hypothetical protein